MLNNQPRLGEHLLTKGLISEAALHAALLEHQVTRERLGSILVKRGALPHQTLITELRHLFAENLLDDELYGSEIPAHILKQTRSMVVAKTDQAWLVASLGPEGATRLLLEPWTGSREIQFVPVSPVRLAKYLDRLESEGTGSHLKGLLARAVADGVSDIHILPKDHSYSVFFRYLGVRELVREGGLDEYAHLSARIKDLARLDIAERRIPQDGAFRMVFSGKQVDFRVATVPVTDGEYLVLRVLDPDNAGHRLEDLGVTRLEDWRLGAGRPDGLCLVCGPTGSGKTTTLNATVRELDRFGKSVFTVEDPVEFGLAYTGQVSVNPGVGLSFDRALRAFMRADPDIIVLGEIRDLETAKAAIRMAETGHLVLATLHAESIYGATRRLQDIGVPAYDLTHLLRAVLVQRLMRTCCSNCTGSGCEKCRGTGYTGRTVVSECAYFHAPADVEAMLAGTRTWPTMLDDAQSKVGAGVTDNPELQRLFGTEASARMLPAAASPARED